LERLLRSFYQNLNEGLQRRLQKWFQFKSNQVLASKVLTEKEAIQRMTRLDNVNKRVATQVIDKGNKVVLLKDL